MQKRPRTDSNHAEIVAALRQAGCTVRSLAALGEGCPDILVGADGRNLLLEIKDGKKPPSHRRLTADEQTWHAAWAGQVAVVTCASDALALIAATHE